MASQSDLPPDILQQLANPTVKRLLAEAMTGEAGAEGPRGQQAVMDVILNRARESGMSIQDVINAPNQFTSMSESLGSRRRLDAMSAAGLAPEMGVIDNPNAAWNLPANVDAFLNPNLQADLSRRDPAHYHGTPSWAKGTPAETIGRHQFYATGYKGSGGGGGGGATLAGQPQGFQPPQLSAADQAIVDANEAQRHALVGEQMASYDKQSELLSKEIEGLTRTQTESDGFHDRYQASMKGVIDSLPDEHKLEMEELAKVSPDHPGDPTRALTQFLPALVMLGGMFARGGGIGAMKAAAAATNAARSHDEEALKKAHQDFQDQLSVALDKSTMAHDMLADGIAKAQGDQNMILQTAQLVGNQLNIPTLKIAALDGDTNAIYAHFATLTKAVGEGINWAQKTQKMQMDQLKYQKAINELNAGNSLTDGELWTLAVATNNGAPNPPLPWGDTELKSKFDRFKAQALQNPTWDGPWGVGPDPSAPKGDQPATPGASTSTTPGLSPTEAGVQGATALANVRADRASLQNITKLSDASGGQERAAIQNFDLALKNAPKGVVLNWGPWIENWVQKGASALGNQNVPPYMVNLLTAADEYAKIISGSTGAAGATAEARKQTIDMFKPGYTVEQMTNAINAAKQDMNNRVQSYSAQRAEIEGRLRDEQGKGGAGGGETQQAAPATPQGLQPTEKGTWVSAVVTMQQHMRNGTTSEYYRNPQHIRELLKSEFKDATDRELDAGVRAVMGATVGGNRPNAAQ